MTDEKKNDSQPELAKPEKKPEKPAPGTPLDLINQVEEIGGPPGPEPTRYGDWSYGGKVTDF